MTLPTPSRLGPRQPCGQFREEQGRAWPRVYRQSQTKLYSVMRLRTCKLHAWGEPHAPSPSLCFGALSDTLWGWKRE